MQKSSVILRSILILVVTGACNIAQAVDDEFISGMAEAVCRDKAHMQDCFERSHAACLSDARDALSGCVDTLPPRPQPKASVEEEMADPNGAGAWGVSLGHCAEVAMAKNRKFRDPSCKAYFENRAAEALLSRFQFDPESLSETHAARMHEYRGVVLKQTLSFVVFGNSLFAESIRIMGDNPGAISAMMISWMTITPAYWAGISLLYVFMRRRAAKVREPQTIAPEST